MTSTVDTGGGVAGEASDLPLPTPGDLSTMVVTGAQFVPPNALYPPLEPYDTGMLDVGDGQLVYYEQSGRPDGKPAVFVHGGPGGGGGTDRRRFFDPQRYRIICFDQRQCGASTPHASTPEADPTLNTTWHLVADLERLRTHLGVDRWLVFGGSWGSSLALAYAETHPDRVTEMVLRGVFTLRRSELDWYYNDGAGHIVPEWWEVFCEPLRRVGHDFAHDNICAYHRLLWDDDPVVARDAALAWTRWEAATSTLLFAPAHVESMSDPDYALAFARIENHFFVHGGWFTEGQLIADAVRLRDIPAVIVQGRYDLPCPATTAVDLHRAWPEADLRMVLAGHSAREPNICRELVAATDRFAG